MEKYIYYSIILFSAFIILLYIYLLYEKVMGIYNLNRRKKYESELIPYIDWIISEIEKREITQEELDKLRIDIRDRIKRELVRDRIIYYIQSFTGDIRRKLIGLSEDTGLVDYEIKKLDERDDFKVALSCRKLGEMRSRTSCSALLKALYRNQLDIKYHSLMALSKIGDMDSFMEGFDVLSKTAVLSERSLIEIVDTFQGDKHELYKRMINHDNSFISSVFIKSAGNFVDGKISEEISKFIMDDDKNKKIAAIKSIGQIGDIRFIDKLIQSLEDESWEVRAVAAKSLGKLQDSRALDVLKRKLSDREWWVRYNSAWSIIRIPGGVEVVEDILSQEDKFAKDILISAVENSGIINEIYTYESSIDLEKRRIYKLITEYANGREI